MLSARMSWQHISLTKWKIVQTSSPSSHFENDGPYESLRKVNKLCELTCYITLKAFLVDLTIPRVENGRTL